MGTREDDTKSMGILVQVLCFAALVWCVLLDCVLSLAVVDSHTVGQLGHV